MDSSAASSSAVVCGNRDSARHSNRKSPRSNQQHARRCLASHVERNFDRIDRDWLRQTAVTASNQAVVSADPEARHCGAGFARSPQRGTSGDIARLYRAVD